MLLVNNDTNRGLSRHIIYFENNDMCAMIDEYTCKQQLVWH